MPLRPSSWRIKAGAGGCLLALMVLAAGPAPAGQAYLNRTTLKASRVLPASLRKSPHFQVAEAVPNGGFLNRYTVNSDYLLWSSRLAGGIELVRSPPGTRPELWVTGGLSPRAKDELSRRGWKITTGVEKAWLGRSRGGQGPQALKRDRQGMGRGS